MQMHNHNTTQNQGEERGIIKRQATLIQEVFGKSTSENNSHYFLQVLQYNCLFF